MRHDRHAGIPWVDKSCRIVPDSTAVATVYVLRVGPTRYVVTDTSSYVGEFQMHLTFDSAFSLPPVAKWGI